MQLIGKLQQRCKWQLRLSPHVHMSARERALVQLLPESFRTVSAGTIQVPRYVPAINRTEYIDQPVQNVLVHTVPVYRVRLLPAGWGGRRSGAELQFLVHGAPDSVPKICIGMRDVLHLVQQIAGHPRDYVRGDGTIRTEIVMCKRVDLLAFRLLNPAKDKVTKIRGGAE